MNDVRDALVTECIRQAENSRDTYASFYIRLRDLRTIRAAMWIGSAVAGTVGAWQMVAQSIPSLGVVCVFLGTVIPLISRAGRLDNTILALAKAAVEFNNLHDAFRRAAKIGSLKPFEEFEAEARALFKRMAQARSPATTVPERYFKKARKKVEAGHYMHDVDLAPHTADGGTRA